MCFGWEGEINNVNKLHERNTSRSRDGFRISCFSCCLGFMNRSEVLPEPAVQKGCGRVSLDIPGGGGWDTESWPWVIRLKKSYFTSLDGPNGQ